MLALDALRPSSAGVAGGDAVSEVVVGDFQLEVQDAARQSFAAPVRLDFLPQQVVDLLPSWGEGVDDRRRKAVEEVIDQPGAEFGLADRVPGLDAEEVLDRLARLPVLQFVGGRVALLPTPPFHAAAAGPACTPR